MLKSCTALSQLRLNKAMSAAAVFRRERHEFTAPDLEWDALPLRQVGLVGVRGLEYYGCSKESGSSYA